MHPGVDLEVHRQRFGTRVGDRLGEGVDAGGRVRDGREAEGDDGGGGGRRRLRQHEDGRVDAGVAQLGALLDERDPEPLRAGVERGARHRHRAVPVAVGFDDREDLHAGTDELARRAEIRPQRPEAHLGDRGPTLVFEHGAAAEKGVPIANGSPPFHSDPLTC